MKLLFNIEGYIYSTWLYPREETEFATNESFDWWWYAVLRIIYCVPPSYQKHYLKGFQRLYDGICDVKQYELKQNSSENIFQMKSDYLY